jgi:hypothetical protein
MAALGDTMAWWIRAGHYGGRPVATGFGKNGSIVVHGASLILAHACERLG